MVTTAAEPGIARNTRGLIDLQPGISRLGVPSRSMHLGFGAQCNAPLVAEARA
jgi:hypothetical protein